MTAPTTIAPSVNETPKPTDWSTVNWRQANRRVRNLRWRIFRASQEGDLKKVRSLQKLMLRSYSNTLMSVRQVTQINKGRKTAGVDKLVVKTPAARGQLADDLQNYQGYQPWKVQPVRRVYIPKSKGQANSGATSKLRPLGIPTVIDRVMQARVKNALEPAWEARFEGNSYGFRPGRSTHDAIARIYLLARPNKTKKWVVDADIKGAFDNIGHEYLLQTIGAYGFPARELIKQWLKAGYMEDGMLHETEAGTPQGGVISPLLANIALHGMEEALGVTRNAKGESTGKRALVRYADDFVVFCESETDAKKVVELLAEWLAKRGLALSTEKTRIAHLTEGLDFLGFNIRHYKAKQSKSGYKLLIRPSKKSVQREVEELRQVWQSLKGYNVRKVLNKLNPIIRGWANYFRIGVSSHTFAWLDYWMFQREIRYVKHMHPRKPKQWTQARYWGQLNPDRDDRWVFGHVPTGNLLLQFSWFSIKRHVLVKGTASPDDPNLKGYWERRSLAKARELPSRRQQTLARNQNGVCPLCGMSLFNDEEIQQHHRLMRSKGGTDQWSNLALVHLYCQQQIHSGKIEPKDATGVPLLM